MPDNLITESAYYFSPVVNTSRISLPNDQTSAKGIKKAEFCFYYPVLTTDSPVDQQFGADRCPVLELDQVPGEACFPGVSEITVRIKKLEETGKADCVPHEIGKFFCQCRVFPVKPKVLQVGYCCRDLSEIGRIDVDIYPGVRWNCDKA
jgi:hypothetical protein